MLRLYLAEGDDPNAVVRSPFGWTEGAPTAAQTTAFASVAEWRNLESITLMLDAGADPNASDTGFGWTPLMAAVGSPNLDAARLLVARGAIVNQRTHAGTALHRAAQWHNVDAVRFLLERGADVNATDSFRNTPLLSLSNYFSGSGTKATAIATMLLDAGADIDARNKEGVTSVLAAAGGKNVPLVELLLSRGADINARDSEGRTALGRAEARFHHELARRLEAAGGVR
jgi:ankyrin repeat protein